MTTCRTEVLVIRYLTVATTPARLHTSPCFSLHGSHKFFSVHGQAMIARLYGAYAMNAARVNGATFVAVLMRLVGGDGILSSAERIHARLDNHRLGFDDRLGSHLFPNVIVVHAFFCHMFDPY